MSLVGVLLAGCLSSTYAQHRAALVPHNAPMMTDGQPMQSIGVFGLGTSNAGDLVKPTEGEDNVGDAVPSTQLRGELGLRLLRDFSMSFVFEDGLGSTANAVSTSQPRVDNGSVPGGGVDFAYSIPTPNPHWRVGMSMELLLWSVPWVEYTSCVSNCVDSTVITSRGRDTVPTAALGVTPSYRRGPWTVFGGVSIRNQPTVLEKIETLTPSSDADVQAGPINVMVHAGVEYEIANAVSASLILDQIVTDEPIRSGPGIGVMVRVPLGRDTPKAAPPPM